MRPEELRCIHRHARHYCVLAHRHSSAATSAAWVPTEAAFAAFATFAITAFAVAAFTVTVTTFAYAAVQLLNHRKPIGVQLLWSAPSVRTTARGATA